MLIMDSNLKLYHQQRTSEILRDGFPFSLGMSLQTWVLQDWKVSEKLDYFWESQKSWSLRSSVKRPRGVTLNVVQPSPLSSPRTFSSSQIKTPLISCSPFPSNYFFLFSCHLQSAQQHITGLHVSWVTDVIGWWTPRLCLCMHNILGRIICKFIASRAASAWNIKPVN